VERDGRLVTVRATPTETRDGRELVGRIGIAVAPGIVGHDRSGPIEGIIDAVRGKESAPGLTDMVAGSFQAMGQVFGPEGISRVAELLTGQRERSAADPVGLVGAARVSGQAVAAGQTEVFFFLFAFFNVFVGILNLLPLPPLDGGHLAVLGVESAIGRRIDQRKLIPITALVAGFLLLFTVSLLYLDVIRPIPNPFQ
jgi:regulator of sigma E protease